MTIVEARERVTLIRKMHKGPVRTLVEYSLFESVLRSVAHSSMSFGNAKSLCAEALRVNEQESPNAR